MNIFFIHQFISVWLTYSKFRRRHYYIFNHVLTSWQYLERMLFILFSHSVTSTEIMPVYRLNNVLPLSFSNFGHCIVRNNCVAGSQHHVVRKVSANFLCWRKRLNRSIVRHSPCYIVIIQEPNFVVWITSKLSGGHRVNYPYTFIFSKAHYCRAQYKQTYIIQIHAKRKLLYWNGAECFPNYYRSESTMFLVVDQILNVRTTDYTSATFRPVRDSAVIRTGCYP